MKITLLVILLLAAVCAHAQQQRRCSATITASARSDQYASWQTGSTRYQIFDITVTNTGACPITRVVGFFSGGNGYISEGWNYDLTSGLISGYSGTLQVGQVFTGAGFVLANSTSPTLAINVVTCPDSCPAPTSSPTNTPTTTPTATPTNTPTNVPPTSCPIQLNQTRTTVQQGGSTLFIYNIIITNTGTTAVTTPVFFIRRADYNNNNNNNNCGNLGGVAGGTNILATSSLVVYATTVPQQVLVSLLPNTVIAAGAVYTAATYTTNGTCTVLELSSCVSVGPTSAPTTTPGTTAPTTAPTSSPSTATPQPTCAVDAVVTRDSDSWTDSQGRTTAVYRLTITNRGPCPLRDFVLSFAFFPGVLISSWNLQPTLGGYLVQNIGGPLLAGKSYNGAGIIVANATNGVTPTPYGSSCYPCPSN